MSYLLAGNCLFLFDALATGSYLRVLAGDSTANEDADSRSSELVVVGSDEDAVSAEA